MFSFLMATLFVGALVMAGIGMCKAFSLISQHVQEHPDAGKAIFEHVFMPLFGSKKGPERRTPHSTAMVIPNASADEPSERN